jgi:ATP-dependent Lon protease
VLPGKGRPIFTGKLGDVMKESIQAAMTVVRSRSDVLGLDKDFYSNIDFHVHLPEGATPKDGPSAGIGICTAMVSALTKIPVRSDVAMTGEITLRGEVLPIGGLKEKLLAASRGGIKHVLIPVENEKDLVEIPDNIKGNLQIHPVKWIDEVLQFALTRQPSPLARGRQQSRGRGAAKQSRPVGLPWLGRWKRSGARASCYRPTRPGLPRYAFRVKGTRLDVRRRGQEQLVERALQGECRGLILSTHHPIEVSAERQNS